MQLLTLYVNGIRIILTVLAFYHFFRRDFKKLWAAVLVLALTFVLALIDKFFGLRADPVGNFLYITVIVMSLYLGSGLKYYDRWSWWDRLIHFLCGVMFVSFGIPLAAKMGIIGRMAVLFFCFTLSTTLHALWETAEYVVDTLAHTDHQRWQKHALTHNHHSPKSPQPAGLADTMNDIIICMAGTLAACSVWWFLLG